MPHLLSVLCLVQVGLEHHVHHAILLQPPSQRLQGAQVAAFTRAHNVMISLLALVHTNQDSRRADTVGQ
jgi:hypothetical protein